MSAFRPRNVTEETKSNPALGVLAQPQLCPARLSPFAFKSVFGVLHALKFEHEAPTMAADPLLQQFCRLYEQMCAQGAPWRVNDAVLARDFAPHKIGQLCAVNGSSDAVARASTSKTANASRSGSRMRQPMHRLQPPTVVSTAPPSAFLGNVDGAPRRRVLVPLSGGVTSLACTWWALQRSEFDVYFCHLVGVHRANTARELACIVQLLRYGRDQNGLPFFNEPVRAESSASSSLPSTSSHVSDIVAVVSSPTARIKLLPMPAQPYVLDHTSGSTNSAARASLKHHPLTFALLYRQVLTAAQAFECHDIVWGLFDGAKQLIESLHALFDARIVSHQNWFPFAARRDAMAAFLQATKRSDCIWAPQPYIAKPAASVAASIDDADDSNTSSTTAAEVQKRGADGCGENVEPSECAVQTAGASLMPDAAHFAWTCAQSAPSRATSNSSSSGSSSTSKPSKKKATCESKRSDKVEEKEAEADEVAETGAQFVARRQPLVRKLNWCGQCADCEPWRDVAAQLCSDADGAFNNTSPLHRHRLIDAYTALLQRAQETTNRKRERSVTSAKKVPVRPVKRRALKPASKKSKKGVQNADESSADDSDCDLDDSDDNANNQDDENASDAEETTANDTEDEEEDDEDAKIGEDDDEDEEVEQNDNDDDDDDDDEEEDEDDDEKEESACEGSQADAGGDEDEEEEEEVDEFDAADTEGLSDADDDNDGADSDDDF